jgi:hypothetical protein
MSSENHNLRRCRWLSITSGHCIGLALSFPCGSHELQFKGPVSLGLAVIALPRLHVKFLTAHGTLSLGDVDMKRLVQARSAI